MIWFGFIISLLMGLGSLAWSFLQAGEQHLAFFLALFGGVWLVAVWRKWTWISTMGIFFSLGLAAYGLWIDLSVGWMFAGALGGLMAWDLADFIRRMRSAPKSDTGEEVQRRHLARLTIVAILGVVLASIALIVRMEFSFEWVVLMTLVAILGISQLIAWLRRGGE